MASHDVTGYVDITRGRADLYLPLDRMTVDEAILRTKYKFDTQPTADAISGTRRNMLGKVLESDAYPFALIHIIRIAADQSKLIVTITLHGMSKVFEVPAQIEPAQRGIKIKGQLSFNQTDFGIVPFSILGGALQVRDGLHLYFAILAINN